MKSRSLLYIVSVSSLSREHYYLDGLLSFIRTINLIFLFCFVLRVSDCSFLLTSTTNQSAVILFWTVFFLFGCSCAFLFRSYYCLFLYLMCSSHSTHCISFRFVFPPRSGFRADRIYVFGITPSSRCKAGVFILLWIHSPPGGTRISFPSKPPSIISRSGMYPLLCVCDRVCEVTSEPPSLIIHSEGICVAQLLRDYYWRVRNYYYTGVTHSIENTIRRGFLVDTWRTGTHTHLVQDPISNEKKEWEWFGTVRYLHYKTVQYYKTRH